MKKYSFLFPILALGCETKKSENNNDFGNYNDILAKLKEFSQNNASQASFDSLVAKNIDKSFGNSVSEFAKQDDIRPENKGKTLYCLLYALFDETKNPENIKDTLSEVDPTVITYIKWWALSNGDNDQEKNNKLLEIWESIISNKQKIDFHPSPYLGEDAPAVGSPDSTIKNVDEWLRDVSLNGKPLNKKQWEFGLGLVKDQADFERIITSDENFKIINEISVNELVKIIKNKIENRGIRVTFSNKTIGNFFEFFSSDVFFEESDLIEIAKLCDSQTNLNSILNKFLDQNHSDIEMLFLERNIYNISISKDETTFLGWVAKNRTSDFDSIVEIIPEDRINPADSAIKVLDLIRDKNISLSQKSFCKIMNENKVAKNNFVTLVNVLYENIYDKVDINNVISKYYEGGKLDENCFKKTNLIDQIFEEIDIDHIKESCWNFDDFWKHCSNKKYNFQILKKFLYAADKSYLKGKTPKNKEWNVFFKRIFDLNSFNFESFVNLVKLCTFTTKCDFDLLNNILAYINAGSYKKDKNLKDVFGYVITNDIQLNSASFKIISNFAIKDKLGIDYEDLDILCQLICKNNTVLSGQLKKEKKSVGDFYIKEFYCNGVFDEVFLDFILKKRNTDLKNILLTFSGDIIKKDCYENIDDFINQVSKDQLKHGNSYSLVRFIWTMLKKCEDVEIDKKNLYTKSLLTFMLKYPSPLFTDSEPNNDKWWGNWIIKNLLKFSKVRVPKEYLPENFDTRLPNAYRYLQAQSVVE